jgi:hypothetical protein
MPFGSREGAKNAFADLSSFLALFARTLFNTYEIPDSPAAFRNDVMGWDVVLVSASSPCRHSLQRSVTRNLKTGSVRPKLIIDSIL